MSLPTNGQRNGRSYFVHMGIAIAIMALFRFIPPFGEMTPFGMTVMGIFIGTVWGWIKCDMVWPSVLAFVMLGFTEHAATATAVICNAFGNGTVQLIIWLLVFAAVLTLSDLSSQLVNRLISAPFAKGRPWVLTIVIVMASFVSSMFSAHFAGMILCWEFVYVICKQVGYTYSDTWPKMVIVGIAFSSSIGLCFFPFTVGVVTNFGYLEAASGGLTYTYIGYLLFSALFSFTVMALYFLLCRFVVKPDMERLKLACTDANDIKPFTAQQKIAMASVAALLLLTIVPGFFPGEVAGFFNTFGTAAIALILCVLVTLSRDENGKQYFTFQGLVREGLYWDMIMMFAAGITLGTALAAETTGFIATCSSAFSPVLGNMSPWVFAIAICFITLCITNLINNAISGAIMVQLMYALSVAVGANPVVLCGIIIFVADCGLLLPSSSPTGALMAGRNKEWLTQGDIVKQSLVGFAAVMVAIAAIGYPLGSLILSA